MYKAVITKLTNVRPHGNADRLQLATVLGNQVVVGLDNYEGQLGIFFPTDGQLSEEYANANDLVGYTDENGIRQGGFFCSKRRVRSQKFRGEKSDGYWAPLSSLAFTGAHLDILEDGYELDELNSVRLCNKYYTQATKQAQGQRRSFARGETPMFRKHPDTSQFRYAAERIPEGAILTFTEKEHGTSGRFGLVRDPNKIPGKVKRFLARLFRIPIETGEWVEMMGTRNVIVENAAGGYYGDNLFRYEAVAPLRGQLRKGEVVYFEIVGWQRENAPIMPPHSTKGDKELVRKYGEKMYYTYGCENGTHRLRVYRIALATEDGHVIDMSWHYVQARCKELGVECVEEIYPKVIYGGNVEGLRELVEELSDGPSTIDPNHIREGVIVRADYGTETVFLKNKGFTFRLLEGIVKEADNYVDLEEVS